MSLDAKSEILVPGKGVVNLEAERINAAVQEYDERLRFGWNPANGDWIIYIKMPRNFDAYYYIEGEPVYPVVGFQQTIPSREEALKRLYNSDMRIHGYKILDRMNAENEKLKHDQDEGMREIVEDAAERMEYALRTEGHTDKYTKVFMNSGKKKG